MRCDRVKAMATSYIIFHKTIFCLNVFDNFWALFIGSFAFDRNEVNMYKSIALSAKQHSPSPMKSLLAHFIIRGSNTRSESAAVALCNDVLDVITQALKTVPSFHERNPWIFVDSVDGTVHVLVDPECESLRNLASLRSPVLSGRRGKGQYSRRE